DVERAGGSPGRGPGVRRLLQQRDLLLRDAAQHGDRIEQLLARALERDQRLLRPGDAVLGGERLERAARLRDPGPRVAEVELEVLELDQPDLLLLGALLVLLLADRVDLVRREIDEHAGLGDDAALAIGE